MIFEKEFLNVNLVAQFWAFELTFKNFTKMTKLEYGVFKKEGNTQSFIDFFSAETEEEILLKINEDRRVFSEGIQFKPGVFSLETNTQQTNGAVFFIIIGKEKTEKMKKDIEWINKIKEKAHNTFPNLKDNGIMYFVEYYRNLRRNNTAGAEKCLHRMNKIKPGIIMEDIPYE